MCIINVKKTVFFGYFDIDKKKDHYWGGGMKRRVILTLRPYMTLAR